MSSLTLRSLSRCNFVAQTAPFRSLEKEEVLAAWLPGHFGSGRSLYSYRRSVLHGTSQGADTDAHPVFIAK